MAKSMYVMSPEGYSGKLAVSLGLSTLLGQRVKNLGVFKPVISKSDKEDDSLRVLMDHIGLEGPTAKCSGVTYRDLHSDPEGALSRIVSSYRELEREHDFVLVLGSDFRDVSSAIELNLNARIAANLGAPVFLVFSAKNRNEYEVMQGIDISIEELRAEHAPTAAVVITRADSTRLESLRETAENHLKLPHWVMPEEPVLWAPTMREIRDQLGAKLIYGEDANLDREAEHMLIGGMGLDHVLERLRNGQVVIVAGDRTEIMLGLCAAHASPSAPSLAGIILNGGYLPSERTLTVATGLSGGLPILATKQDTYTTSSIVGATVGHLVRPTQRKLDLAMSSFERHIDSTQLFEAVDAPASDVVTPLMFQAELIEKARGNRRTIVLPEPEDDRVLRAASILLQREVADLVLLGDEDTVRARAAELGLDISKARVISVTDPAYLDRYAEEFARLRAKKGITVDQAREKIQDVSYFGTMMVHMGDADGMVSGAAHTTAHTIVPSFQIIKTKPGTKIVSSVFLMLMEDRVLVYGDCAVNPDPSAEELADIAVSSAQTAAAFGVEPRVAMISYSTGTSGSGADVDKVREATKIARERAPELSIEGPIQYDASVDASVAAAKLPGSEVAGRATVFVFPDLNTGNTTYKAVQRSSGAVAVGPVLQGLNKPVNDLSRGALVEDIVNTVAITAVQAQDLA